ncbi:DeoR/GlpR family DNA-binding transcription regulator [Desulfosporosinus metallidurans]|uniref:Transcriptional repressor of the fructose operon, DeoR family n=1 Tax=Desulfosporosinus metallidurans TaxID=1888891 RepID=A0A1Q8QVZ0_9FIRM|nr:DeoR/GlpR family DNA-binding transcription regulator [Desulfosporosinus metallidurans]OLN31482.1 Transcriptional repressor of the fructose operon, DeoR family [Desulfosporosinus metallidurans]
MSSERQDEIHCLLQEHGNLTVIELAQRFKVSEMTIRRDLKNLAALGLIQREHGRAIYPPVTPMDTLIMMSMGEAEREKARIGHLAATLISEGDSIILDAGTTTLAVAQALTTKCTVITNSLPIASVLGNRDEITLLMTGGEVRRNTFALVGPMTRSVFTGFNADKLFLGATGVNIERGLSTANMLESEVKQAMLKVAKEVILVAHSAKIGQVCFHTFAHWDSVQTLVTDSGLSVSIKDELALMGVKVLLA